jgi:hypothetical protein
MITLDALLVFLGAASLPVIYLFICSRWLESESRSSRPAPVWETKTIHPTHTDAAGSLIS